MALNFGSGVSDKMFTIDSFGGVDFTTEPSKVSQKRSPDSRNMIINQNGYVEKRTGYRCVLDTGAKVNGIFEYKCPANDTTYHFAHIGDKLYKISINDDLSMTLGTLLIDGLADTKSRGFVFGDDFYIVGAGYIKIGYDNFAKNICYGFVNKACTIDNVSLAPIVKSFDVGAEYCTDNMYKKIEVYFDVNAGQKKYIIEPEFANEIRIVSIDSAGAYTIGTDADGVYVTSTVDIFGKREVCVAYNNSVYSPTVVTGRTQVRVHADGDFDDHKYTGEVLEAVNLASGLRKIDFYIDSLDTTNVQYYKLYTGSANDKMLRLWKNGVLVQNNGNNDYSFQRGCVILERGFVSTEDIITVEFVADGERDIIDKCNIFTLYGGSNDTRVFLAGNEKYPARDFASGLFDGTYFSDLMYTDVGSNASKIIGYHKMYGNLVILKDGNGDDSAQYLRTFSLVSDENGNASAVFEVRQGSGGYGALNTSSFKNVCGSPIYLGRDGVFVLRGTNVENQNNTMCVSQYVEGKLKKEKNLENAVCAQTDKRYYIFANNNAYICLPEMGYEWFYFDSLPDVTCVWVKGDVIYFGASDGMVYRFMNEDETEAYYDNVAADGNVKEAKAIEAAWEMAGTTLDEYPNYKTIRNCYITCMPYKRSSITVYYNTNEDYSDKVLDNEKIDLFSFDDVDFSRFTFNTIRAPFVFATGVKAKNVYVFGLRLENKALGEPFGFLAIGVKYRSGKFVK